jgi:hypothetical protein
MLSQMGRLLPMVRQFGAGCVVAFFCFLLPATLASASSSGASATWAYLRDKYAEVRLERDNLGGALTAMEAAGARVTGECPGVLADEPQATGDAASTRAEDEMAEEEEDAIVAAGVRTEYPVMARFDRMVTRIRWGDRQLTRLVHRLAAEEAAQAGLEAPELCRDLHAWVTGGYQTVPVATSRYLLRWRISSEMMGIHEQGDGAPTIEMIVARELGRYETKADKALSRGIAQLEAPSPSLVGRFVTIVNKVEKILD